MDIFSATNKHVSQPTVDTSVHNKRFTGMVTSNKKSDEKYVHNGSDIKNDLQNTINHLNDHMKSLDTNVVFGFNDKTEYLVVNVMERSTGKIIRRIPTEEATKISEKMKEIVGMIFDKKG